MKENLDLGKDEPKKQQQKPDIEEPAQDSAPAGIEAATLSMAKCECPPGCVGFPCCT
jgi:hypothetical protein